MTLTDIPVTITRDNAYDALDALLHQEQQLVEQMRGVTDPTERADLYRQAATNSEQQAIAWERRPGRTRDKQPTAARCRHEASLLTTAAEIEELRGAAAARGHVLPDPQPLLAPYSDGYASSPEALVALYSAAAGIPAPREAPHD